MRGTRALVCVLFFLGVGSGIFWCQPEVAAAGPEAGAASGPAAGRPAAVSRQQYPPRPGFERQSAPARKPTKIKLHRNPKGDYTWDLTGESVDELIRIDRRLRGAFGPQEGQEGR